MVEFCKTFYFNVLGLCCRAGLARAYYIDIIIDIFLFFSTTYVGVSGVISEITTVISEEINVISEWFICCLRGSLLGVAPAPCGLNFRWNPWKGKCWRILGCAFLCRDGERLSIIRRCFLRVKKCLQRKNFVIHHFFRHVQNNLPILNLLNQEIVFAEFGSHLVKV